MKKLRLKYPYRAYNLMDEKYLHNFIDPGELNNTPKFRTKIQAKQAILEYIEDVIEDGDELSTQDFRIEKVT